MLCAWGMGKGTKQLHKGIFCSHLPTLPASDPVQTCRTRAPGRAGAHWGAEGAQQPCQPSPGGIIPGPWGVSCHSHKPYTTLPLPHLEDSSYYCPRKSDSLPGLQQTNNYTLKRDISLFISELHKPGWLLIFHKSRMPLRTFQAIIYTQLFSTGNLLSTCQGQLKMLLYSISICAPNCYCL